jgi:hypothetical protein
MSRFGSSFVALFLSLLVGSASVSASACDLSCSLRQAHSFCDTAKMVAPNNDGASMSMSMSSDMDMHLGKSEVRMEPRMDADSPSHTMPMPSGMDMGPDRSNSMVDSETNLISSRAHLMSLSPQLGLIEGFVRSANIERRSRPMVDPSGNLASCMHEPCSQVSMSNSPPTGNHPQPAGLRWMSAYNASPVNASANFQWIRPGSPPIKPIAVNRLTTSLRI